MADYGGTELYEAMIEILTASNRIDNYPSIE